VKSGCIPFSVLFGLLIVKGSIMFNKVQRNFKKNMKEIEREKDCKLS
jgi:hypothetical protein